jgi:hypothetical protein
MTKLEKDIEKRFCEYAKSQGCYPIKFEDPARRGGNDRILLTPMGTVVFIEFKRPGEEPRPEQVAYHKGLNEMGFQTEVVDNVDDGRKIIDDILELIDCMNSIANNLDI